ncbi:MAG: CDP-glycerol glycerophosphotransferase family protein, partial [Microbacteriaceae bacterium]
NYLFYEKFAAKAEEGAFELFVTMRRENPDSFFIIEKDSADYRKVASTPGVITKYSWAYYWKIFTAHTFIGTEVPTHLSIIRSNNSWLRRRIYIKPYVFLQHGIIYMKNLGRSSVYVHGREGEPEIIIASSQKEKAVIVRDLLLPPERVAVTGLGQFSLIQPNSVAGLKPDVVTIMLTWRPYDEHIAEPSETAYLQVLLDAVEACRSVMQDADLRILPHPKFRDTLLQSEFGNACWQGTVSDALADTKLLITDYSSIAYNAFYRGAGVVFFQPDVEEYEDATGELIPQASEYIGHRAFSAEELAETLSGCLDEDGTISLNSARTPEHEANYRLINEFQDGKNIERISEMLVSRFHTQQ